MSARSNLINLITERLEHDLGETLESPAADLERLLPKINTLLRLYELMQASVRMARTKAIMQAARDDSEDGTLQ